MKKKLAIGFSILIVIIGAISFAAYKYKTTTTSGTAAVTSSSKTSKGPGPLTAEEAKLKEKYNSRFAEINKTADKRLVSLLEQAQKEVTYKKENKLDTGRIPQKYLAVLENYEKQAKTQYDTLYKQLQEDDKGSRVGQAFKTEFQAKKAARSLKFQKGIKKITTL